MIALSPFGGEKVIAFKDLTIVQGSRRRKIIYLVKILNIGV
jgi:hypothetical protein